MEPAGAGTLAPGVGRHLTRLLAISWAAPPFVFPRAIQVGRNLAALTALGWRCQLVCADLRGTRQGRISDRKMAQRNLSGTAVHPVPVGGMGMAATWCRRLLGWTLPYGDDDGIWVEGAVYRALGIIQREGCEVVATFAQPWSDHLVGLKLKQKTRLPWVVHFSDPWVDSPYYDNVPEQTMDSWRKQERQIIEGADVIVFTNQETLERVMAKYPAAWRARTHVLPHCFDPSDADPSENASRPSARGIRPVRQGSMNLLYAGQFYGNRTPTGLFEAMRLMIEEGRAEDCPHITLLGCDSDSIHHSIEKRGIGSYVTAIPRIAPVALGNYYAAADAFLVIDAPTQPNLFLPSKLIDYLAHDRFVVGLTPEQGPSARVLGDLGFPVVPPDDPRAIAELLESMSREKRRLGRLTLPDTYAAQKCEYAMDSIGRRFAKLLLLPLADQNRNPTVGANLA